MATLNPTSKHDGILQPRNLPPNNFKRGPVYLAIDDFGIFLYLMNSFYD
jgi:hypothetical protein